MPAQAAPPSQGGFTAVRPQRLLDTRTRDRLDLRRASARGDALNVRVLGRAGVPESGVTSVLLNVTAVAAAAPGHVTLYPSGKPRPETSSVNYAAKQIVPNAVLVEVGAGGSINVHLSAGSPHLLLDVVGYYGPGGQRFTALTPDRIVDSRTGLGGLPRRLPAGRPVEVQVAGRGGLPSGGATAAVLNVTVTGALSSGHLSAYRAGDARVDASALNYTSGQTVANLVTVPLGRDGRIVLSASAGSPAVIADVVGYYSNGGSVLTSLSASRLLDSRTAGGTVPVRLAPGRAVDVAVAGKAGVPVRGVRAVVLNVTATGARAGGHLSVFPRGAAVPVASNLNYTIGSTVANLVVVPLADDGRIRILSSAGGPAVLADVVGYYAQEQ